MLGATTFTEAEARRLTDVCSPLGPRYHEGAMAMIDAGEVRESAWAIFFGALWGSRDGKRLDPERQDVIFAALGFDSLDALADRIATTRALAATLHERAATSHPL
jgi:hypothetical protein